MKTHKKKNAKATTEVKNRNQSQADKRECVVTFEYDTRGNFLRAIEHRLKTEISKQTQSK